MNDAFHERFNLQVGFEQAKEMFVSRLQNDIIAGLVMSSGSQSDMLRLGREVASAIGRRYSGKYPINEVGAGFLDNLIAVEALWLNMPAQRPQINSLVARAFDRSPVDIGIRWENGRFIRSGAELLDQHLVNDVLSWLDKKSYPTVRAPFEKGLGHLLHSQTREELLADVITDMYEALEALAGIVTGRSGKDLSANKELFIRNVKASEEYKKILNEYIDYANNFRHAAKEKKPALSSKEAENFVYLTGLFIRLAI